MVVDKEKSRKLFGIVPIYSITYFLIYLFFVSSCFIIPGLINKKYVILYYSYVNVIDDLFAFLPVFVVPCLLFFPYIIISPFYISVYNRYIFIRYVIAAIIGSFFACVTYFVRPSSVTFYFEYSEGILGGILTFFRNFGLKGVNCPSYISFLSWLIFVAVASLDLKKEVKIIFFILTLLISLSSIFVKWFSVFDIFCGVLLAEFSWKISSNHKLLDLFKY